MTATTAAATNHSFVKRTVVSPPSADRAAREASTTPARQARSGEFASTSAAEEIRRARLLAIRMPTVLEVLRLDRAARRAGVSRHAFALAAIQKAIAQTLAPRIGASNATAEYRTTVSGRHGR